METVETVETVQESGESGEPAEKEFSPADSASESAIPAGPSSGADCETPPAVSESTMDEEFVNLCVCVGFVGSHDLVSERSDGEGAPDAGVDV